MLEWRLFLKVSVSWWLSFLKEGIMEKGGWILGVGESREAWGNGQVFIFLR